MDATGVGFDSNQLVLGKTFGRLPLKDRWNFRVSWLAAGPRRAFKRFKDVADKKKQVRAGSGAIVSDEDARAAPVP